MLIYQESLTDAQAEEILKMHKQATAGDAMTLTQIDRSARSTFSLLTITKQIAAAGARFRSLAEPWVGTGATANRLLLPVLSGLPDVEHDLIRAPGAEDREPATTRGQHGGRPPILTRQRQAEGAK